MVDLWNPAMESLSGEELYRLQFAKLSAMIERLNARSPYYRDKFRDAGFDPAKFRSLDDYRHVPFFDKYEERESQARSAVELGHPLGMHITCDIREVNRMSASSGTTGTPSFQGHTRNDRRIMFENIARQNRRMGSMPGDKVLFAGVMSMWVAGIPSIDGLLEYGANVIPIGALVGSRKVAEMAQLTNPDVIVCTPSFARHMLKITRDEGDIDLSKVGITKIAVYGEPGGSVPEIITELSEGFGGAQVYDLAGGTSCLNPIFVSCPEHAGLHFIAPDHAYVEIIDPDTGKVLPFEDGAIGEFVYTEMDRECGPLMRFRDGDRMRLITRPCKCGMPGWRVRIEGRVDDMLLVKGVNVFPSAVRDVALGMNEVLTGNVRVVKTSDSPVIEPPLVVKVECVGSPDPHKRQQIKDQLEADYRRRLRISTDVRLFDEGTMPIEYGRTGKIKIIEME